MHPWSPGRERELAEIVRDVLRADGRLGSGRMLLPILVPQGTPGGGHEQIVQAFRAQATALDIPVSEVDLGEQRVGWASDLLSLATDGLHRKVGWRRPLTFPRFYSGRLAAFTAERFAYETLDDDIDLAMRRLNAEPAQWYRVAADAADMLGVVPFLGSAVQVAKASIGAAGLSRLLFRHGRSSLWDRADLYRMNRMVHQLGDGEMAEPAQVQEEVDGMLVAAFLADLADRYSGMLHQRDPVAGGLIVFTGGHRAVDAQLLTLLAAARSAENVRGGDTPDRMMIVFEWMGDPGKLGDVPLHGELDLPGWRQAVRPGAPGTRLLALRMNDIPLAEVHRYTARTRLPAGADRAVHRLTGGHWRTTHDLFTELAGTDTGQAAQRLRAAACAPERITSLLPGLSARELDFYTAAALLPKIDTNLAYIAYAAWLGPRAATARGHGRSPEAHLRLTDQQVARSLLARLEASPWLRADRTLHPLLRRLLISRALTPVGRRHDTGQLRSRWDRVHRELARVAAPGSEQSLYHLLALGDLTTVAAALDRATAEIGPERWTTLLHAVAAAPCPLRPGRPKESSLELFDTALADEQRARTDGGAALGIPADLAEPAAAPALANLRRVIAGHWLMADPVKVRGPLNEQISHAYLEMAPLWRDIPGRGELWYTALIAAAAAHVRGDQW